jgi:hypothetical protein
MIKPLASEQVISSAGESPLHAHNRYKFVTVSLLGFYVTAVSLRF